MNVIETNAIVLSSLKYGETSLIVRCYTLKLGVKSFIIKGILNKKKKNSVLYFPLNELEISFNAKNNETQLSFLKTSNNVNYYKSLYTNPIKSTIVMFLAELLNLILKEENDNIFLYDFIKTQLNIFDQKEKNYADFHLIFLLNLTSYLGFYPNLENIENLYFDLENGNFTTSKTSINLLNEAETNLFKKLIHLDFTTDSENEFNQQQRRILLDVLIKYYQIHTTNFKKPNSLNVLYELFN